MSPLQNKSMAPPTFSMSETEAKGIPSRTSGAVKALRSCWVTFSSVKEMFPEGMSSRDQGEMMKPMAEGSEDNREDVNTSTHGERRHRSILD